MKLTSGRGQYPVEISVEDPDFNQKSISFEVLSGQGNVFQNGISTDEIQLDTYGNLSLSYGPNLTGTHILNFNAEDAFNQSSSNNLELIVFDNFLPIAQFDLVKPEVQHDPLEYQIDASSSYDFDVKFGGGIVAYEYTFLGKIVVLTENQIGIIFPETGTYDIGLRVKDNDGEWSQKIVKSFLIG
ncbi:MAG: PKD domain-containing protein [Bacteroidota bacterium]